MSFRIAKGTTSPSIEEPLTIDGVPLDLTGSTVDFMMRPVTGSDLKVDAAAVIEPPETGGNVRYDWTADDTDTAGDFAAWWRITLPGGRIMDSPEQVVEVFEHGTPATWLVSVSEVKEALEIHVGDDTRDRLIEALIPSVSRALEARVEREFTPKTATRVFQWKPGRPLDLCPYDLRSITSITVEGQTLDDADYMGTPFERPDGVWQWLRFRPTLTVTDSTHLDAWGFHRVTIVGEWGFAAVPDDVRRAAAVTVGSWLSAEVGAIGMGNQDLDEPRYMQPQPQRTYAIPTGAHRLIERFERKTVL